ncbi:MAG: glycosyltransferase [Minisyncoccia bacterium]
MFREKNKVLIGVTKSNWGGAQRYVFDTASSIKGQYDVLVMFGGDGLLKDRLEKTGIKTEQIDLGNKINVFKNIAEFFEIFKIIKKNNPDILHLNSSKMGIMGSFAGRICNIFFKRKIKIVFTVHGWAFNEDRGQISKIILKIAYWKAILMSHKTTCVSYATKRQVENWPFIKNKLEVIHNGISSLDFLDKTSARIFLDSQKKYTNKIWLGTASELHPIKRQEDVVRALADIKQDFIFFIIGDGKRKDYLQKLINSLGMQDKVILYGYLEDASKYLKAFDIFILTSKSEAMPYAILEAGKAESSVIASSVGGIPEVIENGENGILVKTGNIKEISNAINYLIENRDKSFQLAKNLKTKVDSDFTIKEMIEKTIKIYLTV